MKLVMYFYLINFAFAGIMFAMYFIFKPAFMHTNNSFFYIDFSLLTLVVCTIISYAVICLVRFVMDKSRTDGGKYMVIIKRGGRIISLDAISDTGNELYDSFSGRSVIVCGLKKLSDLFEDGEIADCNFDFEESFDMPKGFRLIPFSTISDCGIMPVFKPDEVIIKEENSNKIKKVDALIGINRKSTEAIFNPKLLNI
jgi:stage II sporulation protein GA (sporulation sigma-E factor processing peptidase)